MELKKLTLGDRIKKLRLEFQKPYHLFSAMGNGEIFLIFENEEGERVSFREKTIAGCVHKAEDFLEASKIRAGQNKKQEEPKEEPIKEKEAIETKTSIRDNEGRKHLSLE